MIDTIQYYNQNADEFYERTVDADMTGCRERFLNYLPGNARILDLGCGSGRDSKYFQKSGYTVEALDASEEMCRLAAAYLERPVTCLRFEEMSYEAEFDGVWACASLLHIQKKDLGSILERLHRALKPGGVIYVSVKYGSGEEERLGRFFSDYSVEELRRVFEGQGLFEVLECFETVDVREGYEEKPWVNLIGRKSIITE